MTDIPIIFSAPMVRRLLDEAERPGTGKTQTRRLAWRDAKFGLQDYASEQLEDFDARGWNAVGEGNEGQFRVYKPTPWQRVKPGDRLWVRENFFLGDFGGEPEYGRNVRPLYAADFGDDIREHTKKITPCIHMPRWASRLTLVVTGTKIEPLQEISEADAIAEGVTKIRGACYAIKGFDYDVAGLCHSRPTIPFAKLWQALHGEESWNANPEIIALTFTVHRVNIDAMSKAVAV